MSSGANPVAAMSSCRSASSLSSARVPAARSFALLLVVSSTCLLAGFAALYARVAAHCANGGSRGVTRAARQQNAGRLHATQSLHSSQVLCMQGGWPSTAGRHTSGGVGRRLQAPRGRRWRLERAVRHRVQRAVGAEHRVPVGRGGVAQHALRLWRRVRPAQQGPHHVLLPSAAVLCLLTSACKVLQKGYVSRTAGSAPLGRNV
jgi:hypothetical protein